MNTLDRTLRILFEVSVPFASFETSSQLLGQPAPLPAAHQSRLETRYQGGDLGSFILLFLTYARCIRAGLHLENSRVQFGYVCSILSSNGNGQRERAEDHPAYLLTNIALLYRMDSLHAPCTPLKRTYDSCFNHWFDEYLRLAAPSVPPIASSSSNKPVAAAAASHPSSTNTSETLDKAELERQAKLKAKAEEYEQRCGDTWRAYRRCLEVRILSLCFERQYVYNADTRRADRASGEGADNADSGSERGIPSEITERGHGRMKQSYLGY